MFNRLASAALLSLLISCTTVPLTGRTQLSLVPEAEMQQMSFQQYKEVIATGKLSTNAAATRQIKTVGQRIQRAVETYMSQNNLSQQLEGFQWEFNLLESKDVNAWCMPGGKVAFYTGILPITKDEPGIAVVMGHEIAHAIAKHSNERASQAMVAQGLGSSLQGLAGQNPSTAKNVFLGAVGVGTQLKMLSFSRNQESEADRLGLIFMAMAGYDPRVAPAFWERMSANSQGAPPEFLSTHPSDQTRINAINGHMNEALSFYKK
jgi:predicted Zn-dependent protease